MKKGVNRFVVASLLATSSGIATFGASDAAAAEPPGPAMVSGGLAATQAVTIDVAVPLRHQSELEELTVAEATPGNPEYHHWLLPDQFRSTYGVTTEQVSDLAATLAPSGLTVVALGAQTLAVTGSALDVARAFAAPLVEQPSTNGTERVVSTAPLVAPSPLAALGGVPIDLSPVIHLHTDSAAVPANRTSPYGGYWSADLKQAYRYPVSGTPANGGATGAGETIGIVMASAPDSSDVAKYFAHQGMAAPAVTVDKIAGGATFSTASNASFEVNLDVQQSAGIAPRAHVIVYDTPDLSDGSVLDAYVTAVESNQADVISSSFGGCELQYTAPYNHGVSQVGVLTAYDDLFLQGEAQGITFVASSGDSGSLGCETPAYFTGAKHSYFLPGVEEPADSPDVTAVGGTNLVSKYVPGSLRSGYLRENATADPELPYDPYNVGATVSGGFWGSGGGFSSIFPEPSWQRSTTTNKTGQRSVPDVSLEMGGCPTTIAQWCNPEDSYDAEYFGGKLVGAIGTSASTPDFAGTVALYDQVHGARAGNINPVLYSLGAQQRAGTLGYDVYHEAIPGFSGLDETAYTQSSGRSVGYDEVIGNGSLIAKDLIFGSDTTPGAGIPGTVGNP